MAETAHTLTGNAIRTMQRDHIKLNRLAAEVNRFLKERPVDTRPIPFMVGKAAEAIAAFGTGTITPWRLRPDTDVAATLTVEATDWLGTGAASGERVHLWRHHESGKLIFERAGGVSSVLNAYLTNATQILATAAADLSWTAIRTDGASISISGDTITFAAIGWYEVDTTLNFQDQSEANIDGFVSFDLTTYGTLYQREFGDPSRDYGGMTATHKFYVDTAGDTMKIHVGNDSATEDMNIQGGNTLNDTSHLSIARIL